jgi:hypothetical protein
VGAIMVEVFKKVCRSRSRRAVGQVLGPAEASHPAELPGGLAAVVALNAGHAAAYSLRPGMIALGQRASVLGRR